MEPSCNPFAQSDIPLPDSADRLWRALEHKLAQTPLGAAHVLCVGFCGDDLQALRKFSRLAGARLTAGAASVSQLGDHALLQNYHYFLVNLDAFPDAETAIESLLAFRAWRPEAVVLLCSREVCGDDFGTERAMITDATLRLPATLERFTRAVFAAATTAAARSHARYQSHHRKWPQ